MSASQKTATEYFHSIAKRMLEIFVVLLCLIMAAKRTPKRRRMNLRRVGISPELNLATLASDTAIVSGLTGVAADTYRAMSVKAVWSLSGLTAGEGPITVGFAHSDYTVTEIKECLEAAGAIDFGDKVAAEQANRLVRTVGQFSEANSSLNDGKPIKTRLNWLISIGEEVNIFAFSEDDQANLTTGATVRITGDLWVKMPA